MWEKTQAVLPSSKRIYIISKFCHPFFRALAKLRIIPDIVVRNSLAGIAQYNLVKFGIAGYGVFCGEK
jgi:hypothetical protein